MYTDGPSHISLSCKQCSRSNLVKCSFLHRYMYNVYIPHTFWVYMRNLATEGLLLRKPSNSSPIIGMLKIKTLQYMQNHQNKMQEKSFLKPDVFLDKQNVARRPCTYIFTIIENLHIFSVDEHMACIMGKQFIFNSKVSLSLSLTPYRNAKRASDLLPEQWQQKWIAHDCLELGLDGGKWG